MMKLIASRFPNWSAQLIRCILSMVLLHVPFDRSIFNPTTYQTSCSLGEPQHPIMPHFAAARKGMQITAKEAPSRYTSHVNLSRLFGCTKNDWTLEDGEFYRTHGDLHRYAIVSRIESDLDIVDSILDRFFRWDAGVKPKNPTEPHTIKDPGFSALIEVIDYQGHKEPVHGMALLPAPRYLFELSPVQFKEIEYLNGGRRLEGPKRQGSVILRCEEHGYTWEVNVLGKYWDGADEKRV